jgi:hypothetical protein
MNTATAATTAGVTIPTIRTWCRIGAVAAIKQAGRWVIDTASLAARIAIGAMRTRKARIKMDDFAPMTRSQFETAVTDLGHHPVKDTRCHGEYRSYRATGAPYADNAYNWLLIRRGATLAAEGFVAPARRIYLHECYTCGLDARSCDCH